MDMRAKRGFVYGGRRLTAGDTVTMTAEHARLFRALGHVEAMNASPEDAAPKKAPAKKTGKAGKGKYQRRDMTAED